MRMLRGREVVPGRGEGELLLSLVPIGFLGGVDPETGVVIEPGHPLEGQCVAGKVLAFPTGKGSTVGSYVLYRLARAGLAPAAIINAESEAIVAVGALIADIPMVDRIDLAQLASARYARVEGDTVYVS